RLQHLADEAQAAGAQLHPLSDAASDPASRRFVPCALTQVPAASTLMQEEIFGPLLPLVPYERLDEAIAYVNARPRPLALYLFDEDGGTIERVMHETISGGVTINEALMHIACGSL
ncbi:aldehyde dehydrogenase, partial [Burkholderia sp. TJI49]